VISAAGNAWNHLDMSLTGALRRLFADAQRNLRDWNRKSVSEHRVSIGMSCFARRGNHAVIAQAGPGIAFHWHGGEVHTYYPDEEHGRPLGPEDVEPQLTRIDFDPGDRVLVISTPVVHELDDELIGGILGLEAEKILAELYHRIQHLPNATVLLVQKPHARMAPHDHEPAIEDDYVIGEEMPETPETHDEPLPPEPAARVEQPSTVNGHEPDHSYQPSLFIDDRDEDIVRAARQKLVEIRPRERHASAPVAIADIPAPMRRAAGDNRLAVLAADHRARAAAVAGLRTTSHGFASFDGAMNDTRRRHRRDSFTRGLTKQEPPPRPVPTLDDVPLAVDVAEDFRARNSVASPIADTIAVDHEASLASGAPLVRVRPSMPGRWKGGGALSKRRHVPMAGQQPPTWLVILVGLGVLLTLVGFLVVPGMLDEKNEGQYAALMSEAQRKIATARANPDPASQRTEFREAQALLLEARDHEGAGPEVDQLIGEVAGALQVMDAVREPALVEEITSLEQFGEKPVAAARLVVGADHAYILDAASGQVIDIGLTTGDRRVVFGEDKEVGRGQPQAVAFGEIGGNPHLLVVDANRALWAVDTAGAAHQVDFAAPKGLAATDIAIYGRDLFVLDASAAVIWRFSPTDNGYANAPVAALETPDLAAARRLFVDDEIVTSDADGTLHLFVNQLSIVLSEAGIDERLVEARQPNRVGKNGDIAIVDAPNDRIVVFRSDGAFDHQYRHKAFTGISAFAMHEGMGYVFAGGKLQRVLFEAQ
jgi:hypothetical protein